MHFVPHALPHSVFTHVSWSERRKTCSHTCESDQQMSVRWFFAKEAVGLQTDTDEDVIWILRKDVDAMKTMIRSLQNGDVV